MHSTWIKWRRGVVLTNQDEQLLAAFHLMDAEERQFLLDSARVVTAGRVAIKPRLTLVSGGGLVGLSASALQRNIGSG